MVDQPHSFQLEPEKMELVLSFHYAFGGPVRRNDNTKPLKEAVPGHIDWDWEDLRISNFVSNKFLDEITECHFFLDPNVVLPEKGNVVTAAINGKDYEFSLNLPHQDMNRTERGEIGSIECICFSSGYLTVNLRFLLTSSISADDLLKLIRQPELLSVKGNYFEDQKSTPPMDGNTVEGSAESGESPHPGVLIQKSLKLVQDLEPKIRECIDAYKIKFLSFKSGKWESLVDPESGKYMPYRPTRPYVGVLFTFENNGIPLSQNDKLLESTDTLQRFIIAAGRTTPSFFRTFHEPLDYLKRGRNVYGPGGSCVFVGRRGWCVFDAGEHEPETFRLGVVESSHLVIMAVDTTIRVRRKYAREIHREGSEKIRTLNMTINEYVAKGQSLLKRNLIPGKSPYDDYRKDLEKATSFLARARLVAPCEDMTSLLETHVMSHTARDALTRYSDLTGVARVTEAASAKMANYTSFVNTSSDYLSLRTSQDTRMAVIIAMMALVFSTVSVLIRALI